MKIRTIAFGAAVALGGSLMTTTSSAATIVVNVSNVTQLYQAFRDADADPSNQREIRMAPGFYRLSCPMNDPGDTSNRTRGSLKLKFGNVRLLGAASEGDASNYVIDGGAEGSSFCSSIFFVGTSTTFQPRLEVRNVKLQNAASNQSSRSPVEVTRGTLIMSGVRMQHTRTLSQGGAVYAAQSNVTITNTFIQDATVPTATSDYCGGVFLSGGALYLSSSTVTIRNSSITASGACRGGAIWYSASSPNSLTIDQSTLAQNWAITRGAGILIGGTASFNLIFSTIAGNVAAIQNTPVVEGRYGGGITFAGFTGPLNMYGNIIAQNLTLNPAIQGQTTPPDGKDCFVASTFTTNRSLGTQLVGERGNCSFLPTSPLVGTASFPVNPRFVGLSSMPNLSGAFYDVFPLDVGSPALGAFAGSGPQSCRASDQLGMFRFSPCDLGAIESN